MEQSCLFELEAHCIQDWAPACTATCPIHLDVRTFIGHLRRDELSKAGQVIRRTLPLPELLGRICDAPCEKECLRIKAGEAINIGTLERFCITQTSDSKKPLILPSNNQNIAVINSGLSSLTVAYDLVRKGYNITLFEPSTQIGGYLLSVPQSLLPPDILEREIELLQTLGVRIVLNVDTHQSGFPDQIQSDFQAVYVGLDSVSGINWDIPRDDNGNIKIKHLIQSTEKSGLFAGGLAEPARYSPVWAAAEGRWAATSITRYVNQASLEANRENEGPYRTRLFTKLENVQPSSSVLPSQPETGYTLDEAREEAERCLLCQCLECVRACTFLEHFGSYPRKYIRQIYNNETVIVGSHQANKLINSCSLCGLCENLCPERLAFQGICLEARRNLVRKGKMPPSAHEFALLDLEFSRSDSFALAHHAPGYSSSRYLFFPGCQLCASLPQKVYALYEYLRRDLTPDVGLMLSCCAVPALWAGQEELFEKSIADLRSTWEKLGKPETILACSTCYQTFKEHLTDIPVISLWQIIEKMPLSGPISKINQKTFALHDPCTTRREPDIQSAVRSILKHRNIEIQELPYSGSLTECCGFGGLMQNANPKLAKLVAQKRSRESSLDYIAYCAMCRDNLARTGKRVAHLLDILFPDSENIDPSVRPIPGWSDKRENRSRLKEMFLKKVWNQESPQMQEYQKVILHIDPPLAEVLEERRILVEDIQQVIYQAETAGNKLGNKGTGHFLASFKPHNATFWVEYSPAATGFTVHNAYCHRMEVRK